MVFYSKFEDGATVPQLYQVFEPNVVKASSTSITVTISMVAVSGTPTTYKVKYQKMLDYGTSDGAEQTQTSSTNGITITGLTANALYKITTQLSNSSGDGNQVQVFYSLASSTTTPAVSASVKRVGEKITAKSFLTLKGGERADNKYTFAYRDFDSIQLPNSTNETIGEGAGRLVKNYSVGYYSFGTSVIFEPLIKYKPQGAGIGFFLNEAADAGYFISLETSPTAAASNTSPVKIFKLVGKQMKKLQDSQKGNRATLDQLFAGTVYNVDVKVKIENKTVTITAYINGFKIEATDTTTGATNNTILDPSKKVALVGISGTSKFDYVYATSLRNGDEYDSDYQLLNFYNGQFSKDFLDISYGDMLYNANNEDVDMTDKQNAFDEFGTVVREIARRTVQFDSAPAIPIKWTTGGNRLAQIIAQNYDNFKADVLVLNNSSITVPLSDQGVNQLSIFGNTIGFSGEIEYSTSPASEYSNTEPVIFESIWLQNEKDVKSLADWILGRVVNKAKIITMKVFGNPLISVGDIITIDYSYQGLTSSQKIIVVKVSHSYREGLETEVVGRTL
jgi:hypothetical protein